MTPPAPSSEAAGAEPRAAGAHPATSPALPQALPRHALHAFLVEDNLLVRENLIAALEELAPVRVVGSSSDERAALEWLRDPGRPCELMIVDIFLSGGSGLGVLAAARRRRPEAAIVVLSNFTSAGISARCLAGGADRVFDKSRDIDLLVDFCKGLARPAERAPPH
jgi:DNA-binding NarL/FixJ family response regulator